MEKRDMIRRMEQTANGSEFISRTRVATFLGIGKSKAMDVLRGLEKTPIGAGDGKYYIPDVVERIMERRTL